MQSTRPSLLPLPTLCALAMLPASAPREAAAQAPATTSKDPGQWALIYADTVQKNRQRLADYEWTYRVEVQEDGQPLFIDHRDAHYGPDGRIATQRIRQDLQIKERHGLLLKAGQEARLREVEEKIEAMRKLMGEYVYMTPDQIVDFFRKARKTEAVGYENALRLDAEDVLVAGDAITLYADKSTAFPISLAFSRSLGGDAGIRCEIHFRHLRQPNAFYGAKARAEFVETGRPAGAKSLVVEVESFDYQIKP